MTAKGTTVNKKEGSFSGEKKSYKCIGCCQSHGASSRDAAQSKLRSKDSKDEERTKKAYSASEGQTNDGERAEMSDKSETEDRVEVGR